MAHSSSADTDRQEKTDTYSLSVDANRVPFVRVDTFVNLLQNVDRIEVGGTVYSVRLVCTCTFASFSHPDMTFMVDWALVKIKYLSIFASFSFSPTLTLCISM